MTVFWKDNMANLRGHIKTQKGYAFKSKWYTKSGRPIVKVSNFTEDSVDTSALICIPEDITMNYLRYELKTGDVVVQTVGSWPSNPQSVVGKAIRIPSEAKGALLNQNAVKLIPDDQLDNRFLYYLLKWSGFKDYIIGTAQGAANQASITLDSIRGFHFQLPPLDYQHKIASILSAYDNLIENNLRRIKVLGEMAQLIYREWFVNFRFPGHETVKMVDSEQGMIPKGWELVPVGNRFHVVLGGTPARNNPDYWGGNIPWINSSKVNELSVINEAEMITEEGLKKSSTKMMPERTTIIAITGATLGQISLLEIEACANQSVVGVYDEDGLFSEYIYLKFSEIIEGVIQAASGGAQQHINKGIVAETKILLPQKTLLEKFNEIVRPIFDEVANLLFKNTTLCQTRGLLLPKLISGQLDVSDIDITTGEEAS